MQFELVTAAQRGEHADVVEAALLAAQPRPAPYRAPAVLGQDLLKLLVEVVGAADGAVHVLRAQHLAPDLQAFLVHLVGHGGVSPE